MYCVILVIIDLTDALTSGKRTANSRAGEMERRYVAAGGAKAVGVSSEVKRVCTRKHSKMKGVVPAASHAEIAP